MSNSTKSASVVPQCPWSPRRSTLHVPEKIENVKYTWLLDTSSNVTCISCRLPGIEKWQLNPPHSVPAAANGNPLCCLGEIVTSIGMGHVVKHNVRLVVIQSLNVSAILGMDTLQRLGSFGMDWTLHSYPRQCQVAFRQTLSWICTVSCCCFPHIGPCRSTPFTVLCACWLRRLWTRQPGCSIFSLHGQLGILVGAGVVAAGP